MSKCESDMYYFIVMRENFVAMATCVLSTTFLVFFLKVLVLFATKLTSQPAITYSKLTIETLEQGVKYVKS